MTSPEQLDEALADRLASAGWLKSRRIREAMLSVPRHLFIPPAALVSPDGDDFLIDRGRDPEAWLRAVYSDEPIVTQVNDGEVSVGAGAGDFTSSSSAPAAVVRFLELLDPEPGHRVLDVGTGTGWTAGLLCHLVSDGNVTSVEVDQEVSATAAENLARAGRAPRLVVGDGAKGCPDAAPHDRVHVTCGVQHIPYAWVEQTRPGGIIVLPYHPGFGVSHELRLVVMPDGIAAGRFPGYASYMMIRSQRPPSIDTSGSDIVQSVTEVDPRTIGYAPAGADLSMSAILGDVHSQNHEEHGTYTLWLWSPAGSWATATHEAGRDVYEVLQAGERRLWDETVAAYFRWVGWGEPGRDRYGMTVAPGGQRVWLDSPNNPVA